MERARVSLSHPQPGELELPEPIIQHIQSFLSRPEATRTSLLAKPWHAAWSTFPSLCLYQRDFRFAGGFSGFARTALLRYRQFNRKLDRFDFSIDVVNAEVSASFIDEIIIDALKLQVNDLTLSIPESSVIPVEVFTASSLTQAFIGCGHIDHKLTKGSVLWSRVTTLHLVCVNLVDEAVSAIIAGCPLIESFQLSFCKGFTKVHMSGMQKVRLIHVSVHTSSDSRLKPLVEFDSVTQFIQLSSLELYNINTSNSFSRDFASMFPCLERLQLYHMGGHENLQISSHSLVYLSVDSWTYDGVQLDVPNICQFIYSCRKIPRLAFSTDLEESESEITIECWHNLVVSSLWWFVQLREFLQELKLSNISLTAKYYGMGCVIPVEDFSGSSKLEVENLTLGDCLLSTTLYVFLSGLLWCCRPNFVSLNSDHLDSHESLYMRLEDNAGQSMPTSTQNLLCVHGLEEVSVEFYEAALMEWFPILWEDMPYAWNSIEDVRSRCKRIRFHLKWRDTN